MFDMKCFAVLFAMMVRHTAAHGAMNLPRARNMGPSPADPSAAGGSINEAGCEAAACMWFSQGCCIGCEACVDTFNNLSPNPFSSACGIENPPDTLPAEARTIQAVEVPGGSLDFTKHHPWRSPGRAPVLDSCGLSGGSHVNNDAAGGYGNYTIAHKQGAKGSALPELDPKWVLTWTAGTEAEVSWGISANHGGGYSYRLCPSSEALTEECFQKTPLAFSSTKSWLRWNNGQQVEFNALRVTEGTTPPGSEWSRNPIPTCGGNNSMGAGEPCDTPQFPPPTGCNETCWGYQPSATDPATRTVEMPAIVDKLLIPKDLAPGKYVISLRWDCEQTPQIWSSCGDVVILGAPPTPSSGYKCSSNQCVPGGGLSLADCEANCGPRNADG